MAYRHTITLLTGLTSLLTACDVSTQVGVNATTTTSIPVEQIYVHYTSDVFPLVQISPDDWRFEITHEGEGTIDVFCVLASQDTLNTGPLYIESGYQIEVEVYDEEIVIKRHF